MKIILLSGGSGKRLWPLSNEARSKQFLKILRNSDGQMESMLQRVWRQLSNVGLAESTLFATSGNQVDMIKQQVGTDARIIVEPERRDTFPAIALASAYLYSNLGVDPGETVIVLPVDAYVEDGFFENLRQLNAVLDRSEASLALIGVQPTYPSSKYGYIVPEPSASLEDPYAKVCSFREKPSEEEAERLIGEHGALWNCGVFAFRLESVIERLYEYEVPLQYELLAKKYTELKKTSFDYEIVERSDNIVVMPYKGYWKDLGTWNTLTEEMAVSQIGKSVLSEDSHNTHIINEMQVPVTVLGLSNIIVAASPDGILVSDKAASPRLKEFILFDQRPMYQEHEWGCSRVLDHHRLTEGGEVLTSRISVMAGKQTPVEAHFRRTEIWNVLSGAGEAYVDGKIIALASGSVIQIPPRARHGLKANTEMELVEIRTGETFDEEDVVEFALKWGETETAV
ncbi:sugar phosphate nucleotidyltransferase [Cohnella soli]|uniref:Sugar phosphate nucleotidyltransferase n=1 Tax=Cohnella soli TaxID=425005 RepID=A0ABW0HXP8_9BACL